MRKKLYRIKKQEDISFVHGKGKRKTPLQRSIETLESYIQKLKEYIKRSIYVEPGTVIQKQILMQHLCV